MTRRIDLGYEPRRQFVAFHRRKQRWACVVSHVRAGKTVACLMDLVDAALRCKLKDPRFAYVAPYYAQAKDVAWTYLKGFTAPIPGAVAHEQELRVDFPNGGRVRLYGADNYDRMRGIYLDGVVLDEPADMHPAAWPEVIRPRLSDRGGWAAFIGTPKGRNDFFKIREEARANPKEWFHLELRADETGILSKQELADAQKALTPEQYAQEYLCSFNAAIVGAYYGNLMEQLERAGRICDLQRIAELPVYTAWDLGMGDSTAIWVFQVVPGGIHVLDHIENHGQPLSWYVAELNSRGWVGGMDWLPQDAKVRSIDTGRTRVETLTQLGRKPYLVPAHKLEDGINALRLALPKMWFDAERCDAGIECLRQYRADYDEKAKVFRNHPKHDWTSHTADAGRYLAMAYRELVQVSKPEKFTGVKPEKLTFNDLLRAQKPQRKWG